LPIVDFRLPTEERGFIGGEACAQVSILLKQKELLTAKSAKKSARRSRRKPIASGHFQLPIEVAGFNRQLEVGR
jgi:hypothetical protein